MRAIDADVLVRTLGSKMKYFHSGAPMLGIGLGIAISTVKTMQTIETERKKGQFLGTEYDGYADGNPVYYEWICSECGAVFEDNEPNYNYCPNCGADMREERLKTSEALKEL